MKPQIVIWDDADDIGTTWASEEEIEKFSKEENLVTSVGYIIKRTKKYVTIAGDMLKAEKGFTYGRVFKVPVSQIKSIK